MDRASGQDPGLIRLDRESLPRHLADHLANGDHSPGILLIRPGSSLPVVLEGLEVIAHAGLPDEFQDRVIFIP